LKSLILRFQRQILWELFTQIAEDSKYLVKRGATFGLVAKARISTFQAVVESLLTARTWRLTWVVQMGLNPVGAYLM
jgi:hypothetical protein